MRYRTACPANTPVRAMFFEDFIVRWTHGGGGGGVSGAPPGDNCHHQEASRKKQKLPTSLWDLLATTNKSLGRQVLQLSFSEVLWAVWVHLGMVHRCLTTDSCHCAGAVQAPSSCAALCGSWVLCVPRPGGGGISWAVNVAWDIPHFKLAENFYQRKIDEIPFPPVWGGGSKGSGERTQSPFLPPLAPPPPPLKRVSGARLRRQTLKCLCQQPRGRPGPGLDVWGAQHSSGGGCRALCGIVLWWLSQPSDVFISGNLVCHSERRPWQCHEGLGGVCILRTECARPGRCCCAAVFLAG